MATTKKPAASTKPGTTKAATAKPGAKKPAANASSDKKASSALATNHPIVPKKAPAKKVTAEKAVASVSVSRTSNPHSNTVTIKKITRNIIGFHMTEDIEIRRVTRSGNVSNEKLKAKYAQLKAKVKTKG